MVIKALLSFVVHCTDIDNDVASVQNDRVPAAFQVYKICEDEVARAFLE